MKFKGDIMPQDEKEQESEIRIKDRRRFTAEGEVRTPDGDTGEKQVKETPKAAPGDAAGQKQTDAPKNAQQGHHVPPMDFATFILSLASSVQIHLGLIANPQTGKQEKNVFLARETIDLLEMLKDKTKGNLTQDEERLFEHVLYELRMLYVEKSKPGESGQ